MPPDNGYWCTRIPGAPSFLPPQHPAHNPALASGNHSLTSLHTDSVQPPQPCMTSLRILYVEDNCELRETMGLLLECDGRSITSCATAEEALEHDAAQPYDLVITDVSLPGMSGTDLARRLLAKDPSRWIVLCSGYQLSHGLDTLGPHVRALLKPFEVEDLEALLDDVQTRLQGSSLA